MSSAVTPAELHLALTRLIADGLGDMPLPGSGQTLRRWRVLASVAADNVALVKLAEGHTDALAIMAELGAGPVPVGSTWGTWAAEPPDAQVHAERIGSRLVLSGRKAWCSGASVLSHGLLTCRGPDGERWLAAVELDNVGVEIDVSGWQAVGMAGTASGTVGFAQVPATLVGGEGEYLQRRGFWLGGAGIAACWWGAAVGVARPLLALLSEHDEPHAAAHLGAVHVALAETAALLRETAAMVDAGCDRPREVLAAQACRASAERAATLVLDRVGRATGAGPLCLSAEHSRRVADLTVFLRQSHAERDLAGIGASVAKLPELVL